MKHFCKTIIGGRFGDTLNPLMNEKMVSRPAPIAPVILTLAGILIGLVIALLAVWSDYESTSYGFAKKANAPLRGLSCPLFIGNKESKVVSIKVSNSTDQLLSPSVRTEISTAQDPVSDLEFIRLEPGEESALQKTIGPQNIDLGYFIFVNASVFSMYPSPDRENTCGIFVLPIAGGSSLLLGLGATLSGLLMSMGSFLLYRDGLGSHRSPALLFMAIATGLAMIFCFIGWWVQPLLLIILVLLTFLIRLNSLL